MSNIRRLRSVLRKVEKVREKDDRRKKAKKRCNIVEKRANENTSGVHVLRTSRKTGRNCAAMGGQVK